MYMPLLFNRTNSITHLNRTNSITHLVIKSVKCLYTF